MDNDDAILPFSSVCDTVMLNAINGDHVEFFQSISNLDRLVYEPIVIQYDRHNHDIDVDSFMVNSRHFSLPESTYTFLSDDGHIANCGNIFKILCFNIRSFSSNFQVFSDQCLYGNKYDIMAFQETRLDYHISSLFHVPGYVLYTQCRNTEGGGVALYVADVYVSSLITSISCVETDVECVAVEVKCPKGFYVCASIYRPPKGNVYSFFRRLNEILNYISGKKYKGIYLLGDWNIDLLKQDSNPVVSQFTNILYSYSCLPLIVKPTRVTDNSATLIDNIWTTEAEYNTRNNILYTDISDHFPIISSFSCDNNPISRKEIVKKRFFSNKNIDKFLKEISEISWNDLYVLNCANTAYNSFESMFLKSFESSFPLRNIRTNKKDELCPYITTGLKNSIKERKRLERLSIKWPLSFKEKYKTFRNKLTNLLRIAKNKYYIEDLKSKQGNSKATWKILNTVLGKPVSSKDHTFIDLNSDISSTPDAFNKHFLEAGRTIINEERQGLYRNYLSNPPNVSLYLTPTTQEEIKKYLDNLKFTAAGIDDIPPKLLKLTSDAIARPLSFLINLTFQKGVFPNKLKIAKVTPVYKKGNKKEVNNYRQISVLPAFSKIYERAILTRINNFIEQNDILVEYQHGFRQNKSTETALHQFIAKVYKYLDEKYQVAGVFLDLSKAFDSLDHEILLYKSNNVGIRGLPLQLLSSYLTDRVQTVYCNSSFSTFGTIKQGVPQGSILGPVLFLIYVNDVVHASNKCSFTIFADDTSLIYAEENINDLHNTVQDDLRCISEWILCNKLKLNIQKTNLILFKNRSQHHVIPSVKLNNEEIQQVQQVKFLGIFVDEHLNWKSHINYITSKLSKICGLLYRVRNQLPQTALTCLYYTLCYPHLMYCVSVWGCTWPTYLNDASLAQKRIVRTINFKGKYDHTADIFMNSHLFNFYSIHKYFLLLAIYKYINFQMGHENNNIFTFTNHSYNTRRNCNTLKCPQARTTLFHNSFLCTGPNLWNSLPEQFKSITNLSSFKNQVKKYVFSIQ